MLMSMRAHVHIHTLSLSPAPWSLSAVFSRALPHTPKPLFAFLPSPTRRDWGKARCLPAPAPRPATALLLSHRDSRLWPRSPRSPRSPAPAMQPLQERSPQESLPLSQVRRPHSPTLAELEVRRGLWDLGENVGFEPGIQGFESGLTYCITLVRQPNLPEAQFLQLLQSITSALQSGREDLKR